MPYKSQFTPDIVLGFRFSIAPHLLGSAVFPGEQGEVGFRYGPTRFRQDALAAGGGDDRVGLRDGPGTHVADQPNQRGPDGALLDAVPDAAGLALKGPGQLDDLHHGPEIGGDRGLGVLGLPVVIEESVPEHLESGSSWWRLLSLRRSPAYWAPCPA